MATADTTQQQKHSSRRRNRNHGGHEPSRLENDFTPSNGADLQTDSSQQHNHHQRSRPTKQLDFYQAMADFKAMFPTMENDVIEAVLRANDGAVDATIDQLLTMSIDSDGSTSPVTVNPSLISPVREDCPEYNEQRSEDSPPSYTEAVHSNTTQPAVESGGSSIWTTPISSQNISPSSTTRKPSNKSPSNSSHKNHNHGQRRSQSFSQGRSSGLGSGRRGRRDLLEFDVDELSLSNTEPKRPLSTSTDFSHSFNLPHSLSHSTPVKQKTGYRNWNPPLLGTLPDDFLRLTVTPKLSHNTVMAVSSPLSLQQSPMEDVTIGRDVIPKSQSTKHKHSKSRSERKKMSRSLSEKSTERSWLTHQSKDSTSLVHQKSLSGLGAAPGSKSLIISSHEFSQNMLDEKMKENERRRKKAVLNVDPEMSQYLEDERLAIMLQNSEFLQELRGNEDFMKTLERDRMNMSAFEPVVPAPLPEPPHLPPSEHEGYGEDRVDQIDAFPFSQPLPKEKDEDAELRQQLKNMGGASRKQFVTLAKKFFSRKKKKTTLKQIQKEKLAPSMVNLLDSDEEDFDSRQHLDDPYNQRMDIEPLPNNLQSVPSYKTVQRPPYHPDTVVTYHDNQGNEIV